MEKGFFASLFDFKFETYITKRVASVMYAILSVLVLLGTAIAFIGGVTMLGGYYPTTGILVMIAAPIGGLLMLTVLRVAFESSIALVDIAMNTKK
jgi:hypothetical protein